MSAKDPFPTPLLTACDEALHMPPKTLTYLHNTTYSYFQHYPGTIAHSIYNYINRHHHHTVQVTILQPPPPVPVGDRKRPPVQVTVATTTCASRVSALAGHRKRQPVQVTVAPQASTCMHHSHHHMCQKVNALNG